MTPWVFVGAVVAGGLGAGARYVVDALVMRERTGRFPLGILIVNISGSLLLGLLTGIGAGMLGDWLYVLGTGMLGGYTTFSSVSTETLLIAERGNTRRAVAYAGGTLLLAVGAAALGLALGGLISMGY